MSTSRLFTFCFLALFAQYHCHNIKEFEAALLESHSECTPRTLRPLILLADNLVQNDLGNLKSRFCGNPDTNVCNAESCCGEGKMKFIDIFPEDVDEEPVSLTIKNLSEYVPRRVIPSPPNGLVTEQSDLPQINLATDSRVLLEFSFEQEGEVKEIDTFDFTFYDIDSGLENAVEEIKVCSASISSIFLENSTLVDVVFDEENSCVSFRSTISGFIENNPSNSSDAILLVRQLAATVRFQDASDFTVSYEVFDGPSNGGRNFLFSGTTFIGPEICPVPKLPPKTPRKCKSFLEDLECEYDEEEEEEKSHHWGWGKKRKNHRKRNKDNHRQVQQKPKHWKNWWCSKKSHKFRW